MSKKFKSQASSARAASALTGGFGFGSSFQTSSSPLSYVTELPDLSRISEPNVVVAFKNLGKKDSTTKQRALEELLEYCSGDVEQEILEAWAGIYPRTSIDNSRRVRQLAHTVQGDLTVLTGKRIAPLLSRVVGSWLAGTYDSDKSVARFAQDALAKSFASPEKRTTLWTVYRDALLNYIEDAISVQTVATLSDERITSKDDAQAKYVRVVSTAIHILTRLMKDGAQNELIFTLLGEGKIWDLVTHEDAYLRRSVCELVVVAGDKYADQLHWALISTCFLSSALNSNQTGSSRQYSDALLTLTQQRPELWTNDYSAKTSISKRFLQFLKKGSQNGPEEVWSNITALIRLVPNQVWLGENPVESATTLVDAMRIGATLSTERVNVVAAWTAYVQTCTWLMGQIKIDQSEFLEQHLMPLVRQYISKAEGNQWNIPIRAGQICATVLIGIFRRGLQSVFDAIWLELVSLTVDKMRLSQPETSKDFKSSQDAVVEQTKRLFSVKEAVQREIRGPQTIPIFLRGDEILIDAAVQLLRTRNGKPYGAAGIIDIIANQPGFDRSNGTFQRFLKDDMPSLLNSPSSELLASMALTQGHGEIVELLFKQRSPHADRALCRVLLNTSSQNLNQQFETRLSELKIGEPADNQILLSIMQNNALQTEHQLILEQMRKGTSVDAAVDVQKCTLALLQDMMANVPTAQTISSGDNSTMLLPNLLTLADAGNASSETAQNIVSKIRSTSRNTASSGAIIQEQLLGGGTPISILTLIDLAKDVIRAGEVDLNSLFPSRSIWEKALLPHIFIRRPKDLSITSPLQGVIYFITVPKKNDGHITLRDGDDFSLAFRLTHYVTSVLTPEVISQLSSDLLQDLYSNYPIALQLVNENLTVDNANEMWIHSTPEVFEEAANVLSEGNRLIQSWLGNEDFISYWIGLLHHMKESDSRSYVAALSWLSIAGQYIDQNGPSRFFQEYVDEVKTIHNTRCLVRNAALLGGLKDAFLPTDRGKRLLNELVADVTQLKAGQTEPLVLLNILLHGEAESLATIPTQRTVFLLKNLVLLLDDRDTVGMQAEALKLLAAVVTRVQDIYGEHWEQMLTSLAHLWSGNIDLPTMNASVRLYARLKNLLKVEEVNEDFQDAWKIAKANLDEGLLDCLQVLGQTTSSVDQPRSITAQLIRRQLSGAEVRDIEGLFSLLTSSIDAVQYAAFDILHKTIPQQQEELSIEMLLEKQTAQLPRSLMSLLAERSTDGGVYMLAWKLVFDHFTKASHKLQEAYNADIKESGCMEGLLDFICQALNIISGRPVDATKFDIASFDIEQAGSTDRQLLWLATHNYYNALLYVPNLVKDWFIEQKNRVKTPLETWTQKYISSYIVAASLSAVTDWANTQNQSEEERSLTVKSSPRGSELTASIAVDPESPPISLAVSLPGSYPLESPVVTSRARVGVSEKNWQSWLRTIQIIILSTGSIVEGLIAFRRNVQGALKGQSECAICYSIIGTDMQTPNKKCGTCKNNFHGTCLFRWFKSSNSSSCPLCRNNFNYA